MKRLRFTLLRDLRIEPTVVGQTCSGKPRRRRGCQEGQDMASVHEQARRFQQVGARSVQTPLPAVTHSLSLARPGLWTRSSDLSPLYLLHAFRHPGPCAIQFRSCKPPFIVQVRVQTHLYRPSACQKRRVRKSPHSIAKQAVIGRQK